MESGKTLVIIFVLFLAATFAPQYLGYQAKISVTNALLGLLLIVVTYALVTYSGYSELAAPVCILVGIIVLLANMWGVGTSWILFLGIVSAATVLMFKGAIRGYQGLSLLRREYKRERGAIGELARKIAEEEKLIREEERIEYKIFQDMEKIDKIREKILEDLQAILKDIKKELKLEKKESKEVFYLNRQELKKMGRYGTEPLNIDIKTFEDLEKFCRKRVERVLQNLITELDSIATLIRMVGIETRGDYVAETLRKSIQPTKLKTAKIELERLSKNLDEEITREIAFLSQLFRSLRIEKKYAKSIGLGGAKRRKILKDIQRRVKDIIRNLNIAREIFKNAITREMGELTKIEIELSKIEREESKIEGKV